MIKQFCLLALVLIVSVSEFSLAAETVEIPENAEMARIQAEIARLEKERDKIYLAKLKMKQTLARLQGEIEAGTIKKSDVGKIESIMDELEKVLKGSERWEKKLDLDISELNKKWLKAALPDESIAEGDSATDVIGGGSTQPATPAPEPSAPASQLSTTPQAPNTASTPIATAPASSTPPTTSKPHAGSTAPAPEVTTDPSSKNPEAATPAPPSTTADRVARLDSLKKLFSVYGLQLEIQKYKKEKLELRRELDLVGAEIDKTLYGAYVRDKFTQFLNSQAICHAIKIRRPNCENPPAISNSILDPMFTDENMPKRSGSFKESDRK